MAENPAKGKRWGCGAYCDFRSGKMPGQSGAGSTKPSSDSDGSSGATEAEADREHPEGAVWFPGMPQEDLESAG